MAIFLSLLIKKVFVRYLNRVLLGYFIDWSQPFEFQYNVTNWIQAELHTDYLRTKGGDSIPPMIWNILIKPDATVDRVVYQLTAAIKSMTNKTISDKFNSFVLAIADNNGAKR